MMELLNFIPDCEVLLALAPEELASKMLFLARKRFGSDAFHPGNLSYEIESNDRNGHSGYPKQREPEIQLAIFEAWTWLESQALVVPEPRSAADGWKRLSRRARRFEDENEFSAYADARHLPHEILHPSIRNDVSLAFVRRDFDVAVFKAMKAVEVAIRNACGYSAEMIGVKLVRAAFHPSDGPLTDLSLEAGEREARMHLFVGALGSYKNPQSHRHVNLDDPIEAIEQILIASHLLRIVDGASIGKERN